MHFVVKCLDSASQEGTKQALSAGFPLPWVPSQRHRGQLFGNADTGAAFTSLPLDHREVEVFVTSLPLEMIPKEGEKESWFPGPHTRQE